MSEKFSEQDLREARERYHGVLNCGTGEPDEFICHSCRGDIALAARIRSEARAGMREACAKQADDVADAYNVELPDGDLVGHAAASGIAEKIRSLPDLAADEAIERIKREARLDEVQRLWGADFLDAYNGGYINERGRTLLKQRIAELSQLKETSHS